MMGRKTYGVDFGTNMIKIYKKGSGVVLAEKNVIAIEKRKRFWQQVMMRMRCLVRRLWILRYPHRFKMV